MVTLKVIEGGKEALEEKILEDMFNGSVCPKDIDKLRPCGELKLVKSNPNLSSKHRISLPLAWIENKKS